MTLITKFTQQVIARESWAQKFVSHLQWEAGLDNQDEWRKKEPSFDTGLLHTQN